MPRTLYLHIGLSKTGSTSIQQTLCKQRDELLARGICYPRSLGAVSHNLLMYIALHERGARKESALREIDGVPHTIRLDKAIADFDAEMRSLPDDVNKVVLSAERCSIYLFTDGQLARLRDTVAPYFGQIRVILYLRRQDLHATSRYSQLLRGGMMRSPSLNNQEIRYDEAYEYPALIGRWARAFGHETIVPRIFQRDTLAHGNVVLDFLDVCGIDRHFAEALDRGDANPPINVEGQALLLAVGRLLDQQKARADGQGHEKIWRNVTNLVTALHPGQGWRPSRAEAAAFMEHYAEGNEAVRREWFPARSSLFDLDFDSLPEAPISLEEQNVLPASLGLAIAAVRDGVRKDVGAAINKAQTRMKKGRPEIAARLLKRAVRRDGKNPKLRMDMARFHAEAGEFSLALAHAAVAVTLAPDDEEALALQHELSRAHPDHQPATLDEAS